MLENGGAGEEVELLRTDGDFLRGEFGSLSARAVSVQHPTFLNYSCVLTVEPCVGSDSRSDEKPSRSLRECRRKSFLPCGSTHGVGDVPPL